MLSKINTKVTSSAPDSQASTPRMYQVEVVKNGDIVLKVQQPKGGVAIPLLVSSEILAISSPVFRAMLDGQFKENQPDADGLRYIDIEDPYMAVLTIMKAIHMQGPEVPMMLSFSELRDVAIVCDKYDMLRALTPWIEIWSRRYIFSSHSTGYEDWLFMSWAFKKEDIFIRETAYWIPRTFYLNDKFTTGDIDYIWRLPEGLIERMEKERRRLADSLTAVAYREFEALQGNVDQCKASSMYANVYCNDLNLGQIIRRLIRARMYPDKSQARTLTVEEIARALVHEDTPQSTLFNADVKPHHDCSVIERLKPAISEVMSTVQGLTFEKKSPRHSSEILERRRSSSIERRKSSALVRSSGTWPAETNHSTREHRRGETSNDSILKEEQWGDFDDDPISPSSPTALANSTAAGASLAVGKMRTTFESISKFL